MPYLTAVKRVLYNRRGYAPVVNAQGVAPTLTAILWCQPRLSQKITQAQLSLLRILPQF